MDYRARVVDRELASALKGAGIVLIEGPRGCGKTSTGLQRAASSVRLDLDAGLRGLAAVAPEQVLSGAAPRLVDEWQLAPELWSHARSLVDQIGAAKGQFIFAGSSVPPDDATRHTGSLRVRRLRMRPMALLESGHSSGQVSLAGILDGSSTATAAGTTPINVLAEQIVRGGWPGLLDVEVLDAAGVLRSAVQDIARLDITAVDGVRRNPAAVLRVMRSRARHTATLAADTTIAADCSSPQRAMATATVAAYDTALERIMVVEDQRAWMPSLRSRARLRVSSKRHYVDPSLSCAALGLDPHRLLQDFELFGLLFESLVVRDLRVYSQALGASVLHYRDSDDLEVDAIVECPDGRVGAFEVKLGSSRIDAAAENLLKFRAKLAPEVAATTVLAVITNTGAGYTRADGVRVVPIDALGP